MTVESRERRVESQKTAGQFRFERLDAWQAAVRHANLVYDLTRGFPTEERFGLTSQMRRSAVSVSANLAEGTSRTSDKDFARFVEIAYGSLLENVSEAFVAHEQGFINSEQLTRIRHSADPLARMLSGLRSSLLKSGARPSTMDSRP